jgi:hypothetical protein
MRGVIARAKFWHLLRGNLRIHVHERAFLTSDVGESSGASVEPVYRLEKKLVLAAST